MIEKIIKAIFGSQHERDLKALLPILHKVNEKEAWAASLKAEEFKEMTLKFRESYKNGENLESMLGIMESKPFAGTPFAPTFSSLANNRPKLPRK